MKGKKKISSRNVILGGRNEACLGLKKILFVHKYPDYIDIWEVEWGKSVNIRYIKRIPLGTE